MAPNRAKHHKFFTFFYRYYLYLVVILGCYNTLKYPLQILQSPISGVSHVAPIYLSQQWKHHKSFENLFKFNNKNIRTKSLTSLVFLLLTLNRYYTLLRCFHCWLWISKLVWSRLICLSLFCLYCTLKLSFDF